MRSLQAIVGIYLLNVLALGSSTKRYCQPGEECWPTAGEVEKFKQYLTPTNDECYGFPTFSSVDEPGHIILNRWYEDEPRLLRPHRLLNFRNRVNEWTGYFVILARTEYDVIESIRFASEHNIGISIFSTGHEFKDRNSGASPNTLLVRTTCLRTVEFDLNENNRFNHPDGIVRLGTGMTWGTSKWNLEGVHELAEERERVVISGHAANVGIVGWTMGGGHSQLGPLHGMGVDQVLEIEMVGADGSIIKTNANGTHVFDGCNHQYIEGDDLFWALRGGGGGTWGVLTAMTIKLHKPRNECEKDCYTQWSVTWRGKLEDGSTMLKDLVTTYLNWAVNASKYWSSYGMVIPGPDGEYYFIIGEALFVGTEEDGGDYWSLYNRFKDKFVESQIDGSVQQFDTYWKKALNQTAEPIQPAMTGDSILGVLFNKTTAENINMVDDIIDNMWLFGCFVNPERPCMTFIQFLQTWPRDDDDVTNTSIPKKVRQADMQMCMFGAYQIGKELTHEERFTFTHEVAAPMLYKYTDAAYFSESAYDMNDWKMRYWGKENYQKLLEIKMTWDPTMVFGCHHCIGDEETPGVVTKETLPSWRFE